MKNDSIYNTHLKICDLIAVVYSSPTESKEFFASKGKEFETLLKDIPKDYHGAFHYHLLRTQALGGIHQMVVDYVENTIGKSRLHPEELWLGIQLLTQQSETETRTRRYRMEDALGEVIPLSTWGKLRDGRLESTEAQKLNKIQIDGADWPDIPENNMKALIEIASMYYRCGMYLDAASAYYEGIYCGFYPPGFPETGNDCWFSQSTSSIWLTAAQSLLFADKKSWALHALILALASDPKSVDTIKASVYGIIKNDEKVENKITPDKELLLEISKRYVELKIHPRGVDVLTHVEKLFKEEHAEQKSKVVKDWESLLEAYSISRKETVFLYGVKISEQPNKMKINPPYFQFQNLK